MASLAMSRPSRAGVETEKRNETQAANGFRKFAYNMMSEAGLKIDIREFLEDRLKVKLSTVEGEVHTKLQNVEDENRILITQMEQMKNDHNIYAVHMNEQLVQLAGKVKRYETWLDEMDPLIKSIKLERENIDRLVGRKFAKTNRSVNSNKKPVKQRSRNRHR